jgi:Protein of unknown function (DUF2442)
MIRLVGIEPRGALTLWLRFSDGSAGSYDFSSFAAADTVMTRPLADPVFFARCFIEAGALAWPNGFDLSAASLHRQLQETGGLRRDPAAA